MPLKFLFSQGALALSFSTAKNNLNFLDALILWANVYKSNSFFLLSVILNVLSIIIIFTKKYSIFLKVFNFIFLLIITFSLLYFSIGNRARIDFIYFQAIYPVVFFQLLLFLKIIFDYSFFNRPQFKFLLIYCDFILIY